MAPADNPVGRRARASEVFVRVSSSAGDIALRIDNVGAFGGGRRTHGMLSIHVRVSSGFGLVCSLGSFMLLTSVLERSPIADRLVGGKGGSIALNGSTKKTRLLVVLLYFVRHPTACRVHF